MDRPLENSAEQNLPTAIQIQRPLLPRIFAFIGLLGLIIIFGLTLWRAELKHELDPSILSEANKDRPTDANRIPAQANQNNSQLETK